MRLNQTIVFKVLGFAVCLALLFPVLSAAQTLPSDWLNEIKWRSIGPANMGGRITALTVYENDSSIWWAASASGGLVKTKNNGIDFEHQFDDQATVSIGDVQVCQSNPDIVWVGTGEANPRNSSSYGDGVYKSLDGGATWQNMGLKKTFQTGRIAINPKNPDIVYVGALGRLWGPNEERGLFKTSDGGKTWEKILYVDDKTGVVDVQMNPKNPDELIVATYERLRDNTDDNDPIKRYGEGSGVYRTRDGGKTFERLTNGLPDCKMGRIGLNYYAKDPKNIYATIESENIAKAPENQGFAGIRTEDVGVGARLISVTKDSPAESAGLKEGDIVVQVDGVLIPNIEGLDNALRRKYQGDSLKLKIERADEFMDITLTLGKVPESRGRRQTGFEGTLGGQIENRQDHQGADGYKYGGVYHSKDGGDSWTRINSLNPRPMYYSQIRVDPTNKENMYVLGTSLYRSKDGGKKFTDDGGNDGIHVDHHALWVDPANPNHMILGNDGGIHVTYDRMDNWDHLNNVAICQFYHVDVDSTLDYRVYGGLQDNGSWGGPNRTSGSGPVNSDWFNVGGGDGFVTRVDPTDKDQIYFESQNGGMGRINLRTGERGFIRPQPPQGKQYRFNWKTPYILSPHNPSIFYTAGNHVFRSYSKGDKIESVSDEITNSNKGAGSAITESPVRAGVIYVGTTCGAVWVTKDGGKTWEAAFYQKVEDAPEEKSESESEEAKTEGKDPAAPKTDESADDEKKVDPKDPPVAKENVAEEKADANKEADKKVEDAIVIDKPTGENPKMPEDVADPTKESDPIVSQYEGRWRLEFPENAPRFLRGLELVLNVKGDELSGNVLTSRGEREIRNVKLDREKAEFQFETENQRGVVKYVAKIKDGKLQGKISANDDEFSMEFTGERIKNNMPTSRNHFTIPGANAALMGLIMVQTQDDSISGNWKGVVEGDGLPDGRLEFQLQIKVDDKGNVTGRTLSAMGELTIVEGHYNAETKKLSFAAESDDFAVDFEATVEGAKMKGDVVNDEEGMKFVFVAELQAAEKPESKDPPLEKQEAAPKQEESGKDKTAAEQTAAEQTAAEQAKDDVVDNGITGNWKGKMLNERMPRGMGEFSLKLVMDKDNKVTGQFITQRGENEIADGKFDPETKKIEFSSDNGRSTILLDGKVDNGKMDGTISFGENFSSDFEATRESADTPKSDGATEAKVKKGQELKELLPGPRWVSSLESSRYSAERCYATFDGHRYDDDNPYVFVSNDYGKTWNSIRGNLPIEAGVTRVIREDIVNENVLYLGCEFSAWVSIDRGESWTKFGGDLPTVAVHDFAQHPLTGDVVVATHGRGAWIADVTALRQWSVDAIKAQATLYRPNRVVMWRNGPTRGDNGPRQFVGQNPSRSAHVYFSLGENASQAKVTISDIKGRELVEFRDLPATKGLHHVEWNLRPANQGRGRGGGSLAAGDYLVTLNVDGDEQKQTLTIDSDPSYTVNDQNSMTQEEFEAIVGEGD